MTVRRIVPAVLALLVLAGCQQKEIIPVTDDKPGLSAISVSTTDVVLTGGDSYELSFKVSHPSFSFIYDVSSPQFQLKLMKEGGGEPTGFRITSVSAGTVKGLYTAVISDTGSNRLYNDLVCLAIEEQPGSGSYVKSAYFSVKSDANASEPFFQTGLPVVFVDTDDGKNITSKTEYKTASMYIRGTEELPGLQAVRCSIRGRGNTTWGWPKKPYLVKLDEKASVLGMPKHKRWVLLANFMDRTLMRNMVSMKVSSLMSGLAWTPRCQPVELVLNGKHVGTYLLIEQVRVDNDRVDIKEMTAEDNSGEALTGGYLLELDFHYDNEVQWVDGHGRNAQWGDGIPFGVKYPDPDDLTPAQLGYIKGYVAETANVLYGSNFTDPAKGYAQYIDVDSFIDYWLVFEVMCNHELGNPGSVFMHKDRGGKLVAGPCWDFDWGVLSFKTSGGEWNLVNGKAIWYERLFQDPAFKAKVKARFEELLPQLEAIPDYMDECETLLAASAKLNFSLWNPANDGMINGDENLSFHDAVTRLKSNYRKHLEIIKKNL